MGPEGKLKLRDEEVNRITAYHEAGHALVAFYTKDATPLHKVTIVPRGPSLGHVRSEFVTRDRLIISLQTIFHKIFSLLQLMSSK